MSLTEIPHFTDLPQDIKGRALVKIRAGLPEIWLEDYIPPYMLILILSSIRDDQPTLHIGMSNIAHKEVWREGIDRLRAGRRAPRELVKMMTEPTRIAISWLIEEINNPD